MSQTAINAETTSTDWLDVVRKKVEDLRYGEVHIIIHDQRVTQIESTEKVRFQGAKGGSREG
jgi:hypothetical protein